MLNEKSTIKQLIQNPIGADLINALITQTGAPRFALENPIVQAMPISVIGKFMGKELVDAVVKLVNSEHGSVERKSKDITPAWWKEAVFYQIYPRSFSDADGDGIGDLRGIIERLPYLKALGIDALWLSPIYDSPNDDNGYDIRDYHKINTEFGTMSDFDELLAAVHENKMRLIMDLVVNHTSDEHEWFIAAKNGDNEKAGYYIFKDGEPNCPPNNWLSFFSGSTWEYCDKRKQWYLHLFSKKQPDLNWENSSLRENVYEMMNKWYDKGVDGFRMDVINFISKGSFENGSEALGKAVGYRGIENYFYGPRLHEYLAEMHQSTAKGRDVFTVGETPGIGIEMCRLLTAEERGEMDMVFNFDHFDNPGKHRFDAYNYDLNYLKKYFIKWQREYGSNCRQALVLENHDNPRMTSKVDPCTPYSDKLSKLLGAMLLTLNGTPFIYQGQELGLLNVDFNSIDEVRDVESINLYNELVREKTPSEAFMTVMAGSRDHARAPMPWGGEKSFTDGTPWLKMPCVKENETAEAQTKDVGSVFSFYKNLIALRKQSRALVYGDFNPVFEKRKDLFCYFRSLLSEKLYIEMNLCAKELKRPNKLFKCQKLLISNYSCPASLLRPYEVNIYKIEGDIK